MIYVLMTFNNFAAYIKVWKGTLSHKWTFAASPITHCSIVVAVYFLTIAMWHYCHSLPTVSSTQPPHAEDHVLYNTIYMWFATQCTVGYNVQKAISMILGQMPSWAHLLVAPAPPSNLHMSDLDSTPFWCKNHFCSFKTEGVTNIFVLLTKNIWWHQAW